MIHSESENTACSPMLTTVSSFLFSQHQKGWEKILCQQQKRSYLQTNMWYALIAYIIVNENYHWSSYHISFRSSDLYINTWTFNFLQKKIVSTLLLILTQYWICLFYLTSGFKTILIFTYTPFVGFLHFRRFLFFCISALSLIKIEQTKITSRFIETAFNLFDVTGDGHINAKVFINFWMV